MEKVFGEFWKQIIKGTITALLITLASVLAFALLLDLTGLGEGVIKPVNQFIKLASVFFGVAIAVKCDRGWLKGLVIGLVSALLSALIFGLISGGASMGLGTLIDVVFGGIMGAISGIISVNLPRRR